MEIKVCVGSSCHLRGSYDIINAFKKAIAEHHLEDKVNLSGAFCLGLCTTGVTIKVDDKIITGVDVDNFNKIFEENVLSKLTA